MAHSRCTWISGTTCPHTGTRCACASAAILRHGVMPPTLARSRMRTSDGLSFQELPEGVEVIQVLAGRDRDFEPATKLGEPDDVLMVDGIFEPRDSRVLEHATRAARLGQGPAFGRVHHDPDVRPDGLAHGPDAAGLELRLRLSPEA